MRPTAALLALALLLDGGGAWANVLGQAASSAGRLRPAAPSAPAVVPRFEGLGGLSGLTLPAPSATTSLPSAAVLSVTPVAAAAPFAAPAVAQPARPSAAAHAAVAASRASAAQTVGRASPEVLFDDRRPAAGVYAQKGFPALRARVLAGVKKAWNLPVEDVLEGRDVLIVGESHGSLSSVRSLAEELPRLKAAGVTTVGVEGLKVPDQGKVDDFLAGRGELPAAAFPSRRSEFAALLQAAKDNGVAVRALGIPLEVLGREIQGRAALKESDPAEAPARDFSTQVSLANARYAPGFNESVAEVVLALRNGFMAERLAEAVKGGGKAVALVGAGHAAHPDGYEFRVYGLRTADYGTLADALKARLLAAFSLTLTGGAFTRPEEGSGHRRLLAPLYSLVDSSVGAARAFLRTSPDTGVFHLGED